MSPEHPTSTPHRSYPKPILSAFGSSGTLQRKSKGLFDKNASSSNTPETPLKPERSKFVLPLNLSPFALSPKILLSRNSSVLKSTDLKNEAFLDFSGDAKSFEELELLLHSPSVFSGKKLEEPTNQAISDKIFDENFNFFIENPTNFDFEMENIADPDQIEEITDAFSVPYSRTWKSSKTGFLNEWHNTEAATCPYFGSCLVCRGYENAFELEEDSDFFLDNFEIIEIIGYGAFSVVYKVKSRRDDQIYALKKSKAPFRGSFDRISRISEVETLWKVRNCQHCVRIELAWEQFGHLFILTEFCGRGSLKTHIESLVEAEERFTERQIWDIILQCALAFEYLHRSDIIHLDVKPENIFLTSEGQLRIGDFGLSTNVGVAPSLHSEGDKYYMAPEVLEGIYSKAADVFSLGLIILELAADIELPSNGDSWQNLRHGDFSELSLDDTSDMLNQLIVEMTHPLPHLRPSIEKVLWRARFYKSKMKILNKIAE